MRFQILCCWVLLSAGANGLKVYYNVTDEEYYNMPPVFHLDDFDACLGIPKHSLYCYTEFQFEPEDPGELSDSWRIIQEINSAPRNYRHDKIRHGICLPRTCPNIPHGLYSRGNASQKLWNAISLCYTEKYKRHGVKSSVLKIHCQDNMKYYNIDAHDIGFSIFVGIILVATILGTVYEGSARYHSPKIYERLTNSTTTGKVLTAFAIRRNWDRLRSENTSEMAVALSPIQGIRVYSMFLVVLCHTIMFLMVGPVQNPKYVEDMTLKPENMLISNGAMMLQTYFIISGWLLSYMLLGLFEYRKISVRHLFLAYLNRYIRLAPMLFVTIGFAATWLRHYDNGPVWHHFIDYEFRNCRNNWWINIMMLNNYYKPDEMCTQQGWYIASDMQLFALGLIVMMFVINNPRHAKKIFAGCIIVGLIISIGHNYYMDYDILYRSYAETMYTIYLEDKMWLDTYIAGHLSIPSYIQGLAYGYWFYYIKKEKRIFLASQKLRIAWLIFIWVVPLTTILIASQFYKEGFECSRLQAALYQGLFRYAFGMPLGLAIMGFTNGVGGLMLSVLNWSPLQMLARVSFSVYLTHVSLLRMKYGTLRTPVYLNNFVIISNAVGDFWTSIIVGTVVCLLFEMPISALLKMTMAPPQNDKNNNTKFSNRKMS